MVCHEHRANYDIYDTLPEEPEKHGWIKLSEKRPPHGVEITVWDTLIQQSNTFKYFGEQWSYDAYKNNKRFPYWRLAKETAEKVNARMDELL